MHIDSHGKMSFLRASIKAKERNERQEQRPEPTTVIQEESLPDPCKSVYTKCHKKKTYLQYEACDPRFGVS